MKVLLTGASGFVGSHLLRSLRCGHTVITLGRGAQNDIIHDFRAEIPDWAIQYIRERGGIDSIIHCGAEVHGLRSLDNPELFVQSNVRGTFNLLQAARQLQPKAFIYVSSAEAVGSAAYGSHDESATLKPSNPYAAAKAAGEMLCNAWRTSWDVPIQIVRFMNVFGEGQKPGKFIPDVVKKMLAGEVVTIHTGGSRHWIHVSQLVIALTHILLNGQAGETYHVAGPEISNEKIVAEIGFALHEIWREKLILPGRSHDMRYSIQDTKLQGCYDTSATLDKLRETVAWYKNHPEVLHGPA